MTKREAQQNLGRLATQMEEIVNRAKAQGRGLTGDERTKFNNLESEFTALEDQLKAESSLDSAVGRLAAITAAGPRINETGLEEIRDTLRLTPAQKREQERDPYARAFGNYLRSGERVSDDDHQTLKTRLAFQNAQSTTIGTQGGYAVPHGFSDKLEEAKKWFGGIAGTVDRLITGTGNPMPYPNINDTTAKGRIIGQNQQMVETDLVFGQTTFESYIGSSNLILIPLALISDSYFDLDALVARLLGIRLGRLYNLKCTVGTGTNEPTGIVTAAVAAGNLLTLSTGSTSSVTYNNLVDLQHSVDPAYREAPAARFMFSDSLLKVLKKLVDGNGRPLGPPRSPRG